MKGGPTPLIIPPLRGAVTAVDRDRVRVRWDGTGKVTRCLRAKLVPVR